MKNKICAFFGAAVLAASPSLFAADAVIIGSGDWYYVPIWEGGVAPVATTANTAIDNLSFGSSGLQVKLTGNN